MKTTSQWFLGVLAGLLILGSSQTARSQGGEPWTEKELKDPAALAKTLKDAKAVPPAIFNVGPVDQIKGAIHIGPASNADNLDALRKQLEKLPKDKEVVIYCGCCPFRRCPNVRPAFELLKEMKFTRPRLLNLPTSLNEDWVGKGYPME
jgi:thiosulfate/3-mercaptopyruvate sulfurtransferase